MWGTSEDLSQEALLKQCPSCQHNVQPRLAVCPHCGHEFEEGGAQSKPSQSKQTMMGIPGIDSQGGPGASPSDQGGRPGRSTMFGLPAAEGPGGGGDLGGAATEGYDESATQVVSGDLAAAFDRPDGGEGASFQIAEPSANRTTSPRGFPSLGSSDPVEPGPFEDSDLEEWTNEPEEDSDATMVASSSSLFGALHEEADDREMSGFSQMKMRDQPRRHETLMGMSLEDFNEEEREKARQTMFSLPTPFEDPADGLSEASEDLPTQAMSSSQLPFAQGDEDEDVTRERDRKRLMEKLRSNARAEASQEASAGRSTMFGIPGITAEQGDSDASLLEFSDDEEPRPPLEPAPYEEPEARATPNTGVLKVSNRKPNAETQGQPPRPTNTGVLGSSSYMVNREASPKEAPESPEPKRPALRFDVPKPRQGPAQERSSSAQAPEPDSMGSPGAQARAPSRDPQRSSRPTPSSPVEDDDRTRVVDPRLASGQFEALEQQEGADSAADDSTRVASVDMDLHARFEDERRQHEGADPSGDDSTQVASQDLHARLKASMRKRQLTPQPEPEPEPASSGPGQGRQHFNQEATRQHDMDQLRSQLSPGMFQGEDSQPRASSSSPPPSEAPPQGEASGGSGTLFGLGELTTLDPQTEQGSEPVQVLDLDESEIESIEDVEPIGGFEVEPIEDMGTFEPPPEASASGSLSADDLFDDMDGGEPPMAEPAPEFSASEEPSRPELPSQAGEPAAPPVQARTPQRQGQPSASDLHPAPEATTGPHTAPSAAPAQVSQSGERPAPTQAEQGDAKGTDYGRIFQMVFGVLAALVLIVATVLSLMGGVPEAPIPLIVAAAPALLGLTALIVSLLPFGGALRAGGLVLVALAAIGVFALGLAQVGFSIALIVTCVGGLFCLAAAIFPLIARAI